MSEWSEHDRLSITLLEGKTIRKVARKHGRVLLLGDGDEVLLQIAPNGGVYDKNGNYFKETL